MCVSVTGVAVCVIVGRYVVYLFSMRNESRRVHLRQSHFSRPPNVSVVPSQSPWVFLLNFEQSDKLDWKNDDEWLCV